MTGTVRPSRELGSRPQTKGNRTPSVYHPLLDYNFVGHHAQSLYRDLGPEVTDLYF